MTNHQSAILSSIDINAENFAKNILEGVRSGIPQNVMEAHVRTYIAKHLYNELLKASMPIPDLFNQF